MTQIVDERLKKMCDKCHGYLDKPCAWLSLGNEYCDEIMNIQQELQRKDNIINELEEKLIDVCETCYEDKETARIKKWIDKIKELERIKNEVDNGN